MNISIDVTISIYVRRKKSVLPLLSKGLHIYSLEISELFLDVKIENRVLEKYRKTLDKKQARILKHNCK